MTGSQHWNLRNLNCANTVYKVLHEGGLVASAEAQATIDSIFPFMPWWLERFAANVQAGQLQFTHPELRRDGTRLSFSHSVTSSSVLQRHTSFDAQFRRSPNPTLMIVQKVYVLDSKSSNAC